MNTKRVKSLQEAFKLLEEYPEAKIVAGGTDLIPRINQGIEEHKLLLILDNIDEMTGVKKNEQGEVYIGALVKLVEITENPLLQDYSALIQAASKVASPQIRNQGTLGGNILQENRCMYFNQSIGWSNVEKCFKLGGDQCYQYKKSPACVALFQSDIAPVLIAYNAIACIEGKDGYREIPVSKLYLAGGKKNLNHMELLVAVKIPSVKGKRHCVYERKTIRASFDFPLVSCAICLQEIDGEIKEAKVVMGAAGVMPREVIEAKELLVGKNIPEVNALAQEIQKSIKKYIAPFKDTRVDASIRRQMGEEVFAKAIRSLLNN